MVEVEFVCIECKKKQKKTHKLSVSCQENSNTVCIHSSEMEGDVSEIVLGSIGV